MPYRLSTPPARVLMTLDAVGGVWRYAMTLAEGLAAHGTSVLFVGLGPHPTAAQRAEAERLGELVWLDLPLDWLAGNATELEQIPAALERLAGRRDIDLLHLNLPSQAAGLGSERPTVVVSHSCVVSWFRAVRQTDVPDDWHWQYRLNRDGLLRADAVLVPSRSHGEALSACYGPLGRTIVAYNGARAVAASSSKRAVVLAAARWWDDAKNGATLDVAAASTDWPVLMAGATMGPNGAALALANAHALGELSNARLRALLAQAAIVASPSVYEPFGLVALEAAQAGAALLLADIPTYRELWSDTAVFVPARDAAAWAEAINDLAADRPRRQALAAEAGRRAQLYTPEAQLAGVLEAYAQAMDRSAGGKMVA